MATFDELMVKWGQQGQQGQSTKPQAKKNTNAGGVTGIADSLKDVKKKEVGTLDGIIEGVKEFGSGIWDLAKYGWTEFVSNKDEEKGINDWDKYKEYMSKLSKTEDRDEYMMYYNKLYNEVGDNGKTIVDKDKFDEYQNKQKSGEDYKFEQQKDANKQVFFDRLESDMKGYVSQAGNKYQIESLNKGLEQMESQYTMMYDSMMKAYKDTRDENILKARDEYSKKYEDSISKITTAWADNMINKGMSYQDAYSAVIDNNNYKQLANDITTIERKWRDGMYKNTILSNFSTSGDAFEGLNIVKGTLSALTGVKNTLTWAASKIGDALEEGKEMFGRYDVSEELRNLRVYDEETSGLKKLAGELGYFGNQLIDTLPSYGPAIIELLLTKKLGGIDGLKQLNKVMGTTNKAGQELMNIRRSARFIQDLAMDNLVYDNVFQLMAGGPITSEDENVNFALNIVTDGIGALLSVPAKWYKPAMKETELVVEEISADAYKFIKRNLGNMDVSDMKKLTDKEKETLRYVADGYYIRRGDEVSKGYKGKTVKLSDLSETERKLIQKVQEESKGVWTRLSQYEGNARDLLVAAEDMLGKKGRSLSSIDAITTAAKNIYEKSKIGQNLGRGVVYGASNTGRVIKEAMDKGLMNDEAVKAIISNHTNIEGIQDVVFGLIKGNAGNDLVTSGLAKLGMNEANDLTFETINKIYNNIAADILEANPNLIEVGEAGIGNYVKGADGLFRDIFNQTSSEGLTLDKLIELLRTSEEGTKFGSDSIRIPQELSRIADKMLSATTEEGKQMFDKADISGVFGNVTRGWKDNSVARQTMIKNLFTKNGFEFIVKEDGTISIMATKDAIESYVSAMVKAGNGLGLMSGREVDALLLTHHAEVIKSYDLYMQNLGNEMAKTSKGEVKFNAKQFTEGYHTWFEQLFAKAGDGYVIKNVFNTDAVNNEWIQLLGNNPTFKEIEEFAATNLIKDLTVKAFEGEDNKLYNKIYSTLASGRYVKGYDKEIIPVVNSIYNQVLWLKSLGIDTTRAGEAVGEIFGKLCVDIQSIRTLSNIDNQYLYRGILSRVIMGDNIGREIYLDALGKTFKQLSIEGKDITQLRGLMDEIEKLQFTDNFTKTFNDAKKKLNKELKDIDKEIKSLEKSKKSLENKGYISKETKDRIDELNLERDKLQDKFDTYERNSLDTEEIEKKIDEIDEELEKLENEGDNIDEKIAELKNVQGQKQNAFNTKYSAYANKDGSLDIKDTLTNKIDKLIAGRTIQEGILGGDSKAVNDTLKQLRSQLSGKSKSKGEVTYTKDSIFIKDLRDATDEDLELIAKTSAYASAVKYNIYNTKQIDKVADSMFQSMKKLKVQGYKTPLTFSLNGVKNSDDVNLGILSEAQLLASLLNPRAMAKHALGIKANEALNGLSLTQQLAHLQEAIENIQYMPIQKDYLQFINSISKYIQYGEDNKGQLNSLINSIKDSDIMNMEYVIGKINSMYKNGMDNRAVNNASGISAKMDFIDKITAANDELQDIMSGIQAALLLQGKVGDEETKTFYEALEMSNKITTLFNRTKEAALNNIQADKLDGILRSDFKPYELKRQNANIKWHYGENEEGLNDIRLDMTLPESMNGKKFLFYDLETNGLKDDKTEITQASYRLMEVKDGKLVEIKKSEEGKLYGVSSPDRGITKDVSTLTKITNEMISGKKQFKGEGTNEFNEMLKDKNIILVGHNIKNADNKWLASAGVDTSKHQSIDTYELSRYLFPNKRTHKLEYYDEKNFQSIQRYLDENGIESGSHDANFDTLKTMLLFELMAKKLDKDGVKTFDDFGKALKEAEEAGVVFEKKLDIEGMDYSLKQMYTNEGYREGLKADMFIKELDNEFPEGDFVVISDVLPYLSARIGSNKGKKVLEGILKIIPANSVISKNKLFAGDAMREAFEEMTSEGIDEATFLMNRIVNNILNEFGINTKGVITALEAYSEKATKTDLLNNLIQFSDNGRVRGSKDINAFMAIINKMADIGFIKETEGMEREEMINEIKEFLSKKDMSGRIASFNKAYYEYLQTNKNDAQGEIFIQNLQSFIGELFNPYEGEVANKGNSANMFKKVYGEMNELEKEIDRLEKRKDLLTEGVSDDEISRINDELVRLTEEYDSKATELNIYRNNLDSPFVKYWTNKIEMPELVSQYTREAVHAMDLGRIVEVDKEFEKAIDNILEGVEAYTVRDLISGILEDMVEGKLISSKQANSIYGGLDLYEFTEMYEEIIDALRYGTVTSIEDLNRYHYFDKFLISISQKTHKYNKDVSLDTLLKMNNEKRFQYLEAQAHSKSYTPVLRGGYENDNAALRELDDAVDIGIKDINDYEEGQDMAEALTRESEGEVEDNIIDEFTEEGDKLKGYENFEGNGSEGGAKSDTLSVGNARGLVVKRYLEPFIRDDLEGVLAKAGGIKQDSRFAIEETSESMKGMKGQRYNVGISTYARLSNKSNNGDKLKEYIFKKSEEAKNKEGKKSAADNASINAETALSGRRTDLSEEEGIELFGIDGDNSVIGRELKGGAKIEGISLSLSYSKPLPIEFKGKDNIEKGSNLRGKSDYNTFDAGDMNSDSFDTYGAIEEIFRCIDNNGRIRMNVDVVNPKGNKFTKQIYLDAEYFWRTQAGKTVLRRLGISAGYGENTADGLAAAISRYIYPDVIKNEFLRDNLKTTLLDVKKIYDKAKFDSKGNIISRDGEKYLGSAADNWNDELFIAMLNEGGSIKRGYIPELNMQAKSSLINKAKKNFSNKEIEGMTSSEKTQIMEGWSVADKDTWKEIFRNGYLSYEDLDDVVKKWTSESTMGEYVFKKAQEKGGGWRNKLGVELVQKDKRFRNYVYNQYDNKVISLYDTLSNFKNKGENVDSMFDKIRNFSFNTYDAEGNVTGQYKLLGYRQDYIVSNKGSYEYGESQNAQFNIADDYDDLYVVQGKEWVTDEVSRNNDLHNVELSSSDEFLNVRYINEPEVVVAKMYDEATGNIVYGEIHITPGMGMVKYDSAHPDVRSSATSYEFFPFKDNRDILAKESWINTMTKEEYKDTSSLLDFLEAVIKSPDYLGLNKEDAKEFIDNVIKNFNSGLVFKGSDSIKAINKKIKKIISNKGKVDKKTSEEILELGKPIYRFEGSFHNIDAVNEKGVIGGGSSRVKSDKSKMKADESKMKADTKKEEKDYKEKWTTGVPSNEYSKTVDESRLNEYGYTRENVASKYDEEVDEKEKQRILDRLRELNDTRLEDLEKELSDAEAEVAKAKALGDLSENAEYAAALEKKSLAEAKIKEFKERIDGTMFKKEDKKVKEYSVEDTSLSGKMRRDYNKGQFSQLTENPNTILARTKRYQEAVTGDGDEIMSSIGDRITDRVWKSRQLLFTNYDIVTHSPDLRQIVGQRDYFVAQFGEEYKAAVTKFEELLAPLSKDERLDIHNKIKAEANKLIKDGMDKAKRIEVRDLQPEVQEALDNIVNIFNKAEWDAVYQLGGMVAKDGFDGITKNIAHNHLASAYQYFKTSNRGVVESKLKTLVSAFETDSKRIDNTVSDIVGNPLGTGKFYDFMSGVRSARRFVKYGPLMPLAGTLMFLNSAVMGIGRYASERRGYRLFGDNESYKRLIRPKSEGGLGFADSMNRANEILFSSNSDLGGTWFDRVLDVMLSPLPSDSWITKYIQTATKGGIHSVFDLLMEGSIKEMALSKALIKNRITVNNIDDFVKKLEAGQVSKYDINNILADTDKIYSRFFTNSATSLFSRHRFSRWYMFNALQGYVINRTDEITSSIRDCVNWLGQRQRNAGGLMDSLSWNEFTEYLERDNQELKSLLMNVIQSVKVGYYMEKIADGGDMDYNDYRNYIIDSSDYLSALPATFMSSILMAPFEGLEDYAEYAEANYQDFDLGQGLTVAGVNTVSSILTRFFKEGKILNALSEGIVSYGKYGDMGFTYDVLQKEFEKISSGLGRYQLVEGTNMYGLSNMTTEGDMMGQLLFNGDKTSYAGKVTSKLQSLATVDKILNGETKDFFMDNILPYLPVLGNALRNAIDGQGYNFSAAKYDELQHIMDKDKNVQRLLNFSLTQDGGRFDKSGLFADSNLYSDESINRLYQELTAFNYADKQQLRNGRFETGYAGSNEPMKEEVFTELMKGKLSRDDMELVKQLAKNGIGHKQAGLLKIMAAAEASEPGSSKIVLGYLANQYQYNRLKEETKLDYPSSKDVSDEVLSDIQRDTVDIFYPYMVTADKTSWYKAITEYISGKYDVLDTLYKDDDLTGYVSTLGYMDMLMYQQAHDGEVHSNYIKNSRSMLSKYFKSEEARMNAINYTMSSIQDAGFSNQQATEAKMGVLAANMDFYDKIQKNQMMQALYGDDIDRYNWYVWGVMQDINKLGLDITDDKYKKSYGKYNKWKPYNTNNGSGDNTPAVQKFVPQAQKYLDGWTPSKGRTLGYNTPKAWVKAGNDLKFYRDYYEKLIKDATENLVKSKAKTYPAEYGYVYSDYPDNKGLVRKQGLSFAKRKQKQYSTKVLSNLPGSHG